MADDGNIQSIISAAREPLRRTIPIARFDGRQILPWRREIDTLGDCLDHGRALHVRCGCNPRIIEVLPHKLLALHNPPKEETRLSQLRPWLLCNRCGSRDRIVVEATNHWRGGLIPRKPQPARQIYPRYDPPSAPSEPFVPVPDTRPRVGGKGKRKNKR